jgi:hypothetical protein
VLGRLGPHGVLSVPIYRVALGHLVFDDEPHIGEGSAVELNRALHSVTGANGKPSESKLTGLAAAGLSDVAPCRFCRYRPDRRLLPPCVGAGVAILSNETVPTVA